MRGDLFLLLIIALLRTLLSFVWIRSQDRPVTSNVSFIVVLLCIPIPTLFVMCTYNVCFFFCHLSDEGRWDCKQLMYNDSFTPTRENAQRIENWNQHYGFHPSVCRFKNSTPFSACNNAPSIATASGFPGYRSRGGTRLNTQSLRRG